MERLALSVYHLATAGPVLKDISFTVNPGEKFGIAGRPGSGKTSIVNALFRMPECGGKIMVEGVGISNLELQASRRGISVITKEPTLFMGLSQGFFDAIPHRLTF